jgi:uncharacterized membrane protein
MIRQLIAVLAWLDRRFPPKVTVTKEAFESMIERETQRRKQIERALSEIDSLKERVKKEEDATAAIKKVLMEAATAGAVQEKRRSAFVESGRFPAEAA